jgi:hypothetical protein
MQTKQLSGVQHVGVQRLHELRLTAGFQWPGTAACRRCEDEPVSGSPQWASFSLHTSRPGRIQQLAQCTSHTTHAHTTNCATNLACTKPTPAYTMRAATPVRPLHRDMAGCHCGRRMQLHLLTRRIARCSAEAAGLGMAVTWVWFHALPCPLVPDTHTLQHC